MTRRREDDVAVLTGIHLVDTFLYGGTWTGIIDVDIQLVHFTEKSVLVNTCRENLVILAEGALCLNRWCRLCAEVVKLLFKQILTCYVTGYEIECGRNRVVRTCKDNASVILAV